MFLVKSQRGVLGIMVVLVSITMTPLSYADSEFEESLFSVFDWINEIVTPSIQDPSFDNATQTNYLNTLDAGTESGKKGVSLWFGIHEFFVNMIFVDRHFLKNTFHPAISSRLLLL